MPGSGWFTPEESEQEEFPGSDERTVPLHPYTIEENIQDAKAALDKIQGEYTKNADHLQQELSDHARQVQERIHPPEWPA